MRTNFVDTFSKKHVDKFPSQFLSDTNRFSLTDCPVEEMLLIERTHIPEINMLSNSSETVRAKIENLSFIVVLDVAEVLYQSELEAIGAMCFAVVSHGAWRILATLLCEQHFKYRWYEILLEHFPWDTTKDWEDLTLSDVTQLPDGALEHLAICNVCRVRAESSLSALVETKLDEALVIIARST